MSLKFHQKLKNAEKDLASFNVDAVYGKTVFELKENFANIRNLHASFMQICMISAYHKQHNKFVLVIHNSTISDERLKAESTRIKELFNPEILERVVIISVSQDLKVSPLYNDLTEDEEKQIPRLIEQASQSKKNVVKAGSAAFNISRVLLIHYLRQDSPVTIKQLSEESNYSYPTIAKLLEKYSAILEKRSDKKVRFRQFPSTFWTEAVTFAPSERNTCGYAVLDGNPRSLDALLKRLSHVNTPNWALGGVYAARHYYPGLDMVGTPRLDITLHRAKKGEEEKLIRRLDPALSPINPHDSNILPQVVIHHLEREAAFFVKNEQDLPISDEVDCLLDLEEARLHPLAEELLTHLLNHE